MTNTTIKDMDRVQEILLEMCRLTKDFYEEMQETVKAGEELLARNEEAQNATAIRIRTLEADLSGFARMEASPALDTARARFELRLEEQKKRSKDLKKNREEIETFQHDYKEKMIETNWFVAAERISEVCSAGYQKVSDYKNL